MPSTISISPTENSIDSPTRGGITHDRATHDQNRELWPNPHAAPKAAALEVFSPAPRSS